MSYDSTPDTLDHIGKVQTRLKQMTDNLKRRADVHDASKLKSPEKEGFDVVTERLKGVEYGSAEYKANLALLRPTTERHYRNNDHHPEHFEDGINGMSLLGLSELMADWKAAGERMSNGDIRKSLEINRERFGISDQLYDILLNTIEEMGW